MVTFSPIDTLIPTTTIPSIPDTSRRIAFVSATCSSLPSTARVDRVLDRAPPRRRHRPPRRHPWRAASSNTHHGAWLPITHRPPPWLGWTSHPRRTRVPPRPARAPSGWALVPIRTTPSASWRTASPNCLTGRGPASTLLRAEPYAAAFHVTYPEREVSLDRLAALARGEDPHRTLVVAPGGREAVRHLLGVKPGDALELADWESAKEYVAIHPEAWALLPWEAIDFRVRALPVDGARPDPRDGDGSPLVRRLWLLAARGDVQPLEGALIAALRYELPPVVELVAVGDIMLGRTVGRLIAGDSVRYPFEGEGILPILQGADVAFGNLECPISDRGSPVSKTYTFRADPAAVEGLVWAGMDVLSLANNHLGDYGVDAVYDTLRHLAESGLGVTGAGETEDAAHAPHIVEVGELRLAFLAFNQIHPKTFAATGALPGLAWMEWS